MDVIEGLALSGDARRPQRAVNRPGPSASAAKNAETGGCFGCSTLLLHPLLVPVAIVPTEIDSR
jgi:hypothetical protein